MTSRGKFWGATGDARQNFGGAVAPPGTPLAPPLTWNSVAQLQARGPNVAREPNFEGPRTSAFI